MKHSNPKIKRSYSIVAHGPDVVELRQGVWNTVSFTLTDDGAQGRLFQVLRSLDGTQPTRDIAKAHGLKINEVESLIDHLLQLDVLELETSSAIDYYLDEMVPALRPVMSGQKKLARVVLLGDDQLVASLRTILKESLPTTEVVVPDKTDRARAAWERSDAETLLRGLELEGAARELEAWRDALVVYAQRHIRPDRSTTLNRLAIAAGVTWMNVGLDGPFLLVGPTFVPKHGACYECLDTRVLMNVRESQNYQSYKNALVERQVVEGDLPVVGALAATLAGHAALEICNMMIAGANFTKGQMLSVYIPTMAFTFHEVLRLPGCSACGASPERDDQELYFDMRALAAEEHAE